MYLNLIKVYLKLNAQPLMTTPETVAAPRKRLFEAGEMKLLVLYFVAQKPKFSYDVIKDVACLVGGNYKPSTGTICPTFNYLEEQQYVEAHICEDERKQYHITAKGQSHLAQQQDKVQKVLDRFSMRKRIQSDEQYVDIKRAMENLKTSLRLRLQGTELSQDQIREVADKIDLAAIQISRS